MDAWQAIVDRLEGVGAWLAPLGLRLLLAWEFFEAGLQKLNGSNWFGGVQDKFPFPFNAIPADLNWLLATWSELVFAVLLALGLATRFAAFSLFVLTVVAIAAVHWPADWNSLSELARGYAISNDGYGNYKLGLIFVVMLVPLILRGGGKLSLDALLAHLAGAGPARPWADLSAWGIAALALGAPLVMLLPTLGVVFAALGLALLLGGRFLRH